MPSWLIWIALAATLGTAEVLTMAFAAGLMAGAALLAALVAGFGGGLAAQSVTFALTSFVALPLAVPIARRRLARPDTYRSGVSGLADRSAIVLTQVDSISGTVRIGGGVWSARAYDETHILPEGTPVTVFEIEGAIALVYPREFT